MALVQNGYVIMRLSLIKIYIAIYWDETGESSISIALLYDVYGNVYIFI